MYWRDWSSDVCSSDLVSRNRCSSATRSASGTPMPTNPEVQNASPFWMTATASAAVTILLRMTASPDHAAFSRGRKLCETTIMSRITASAGRLLGGPAAVHGERLPADLLGGVRTQENRKGPQLLSRDELKRGLLFGQKIMLGLRDGNPLARGAVV